jgi:hypothetical protein
MRKQQAMAMATLCLFLITPCSPSRFVTISKLASLCVLRLSSRVDLCCPSVSIANLTPLDEGT